MLNGRWTRGRRARSYGGILWCTVEGPPSDSDELFAEWYVWAKREVTSDPRVCLGVAQAATEALSSGADRTAAEAAARRSVAGPAVMLIPKVSPWRQGYAEWYDWARLEFGGNPVRLHRLARVAIDRLKVDGDAGHAAEAARAAAAVDQPAAGAGNTSPGAAGTSWPQGGSGTTGGWGQSGFSRSGPAIGTGTVMASATGPGVVPASPPHQRPAFASGPPRPVTFERVAYAGFGRRLGAAAIDGVLALVLTVLVVVVVGAFWFIAAVSTREASNEQVALTEVALLVILGVVFWVYDAGLESSLAEATLGKRAVRVVVLDKYACRISFARATARHFTKFIPLALGLLPLILSVQALISGIVDVATVIVGVVGVAFLVLAGIEFLPIALTRQRRGLHDLIAGTVVVRRDMLSRVVADDAAPPPVPQTVPDSRSGIPAGAARPAQTRLR
jgi:uncharacterized RDD family membrane protein YckC